MVVHWLNLKHRPVAQVNDIPDLIADSDPIYKPSVFGRTSQFFKLGLIVFFHQKLAFMQILSLIIIVIIVPPKF